MPPSWRGAITTPSPAWSGGGNGGTLLEFTDKTLPALIGCIDQTLHHSDGVPTYALTDNERTVTTDHVARIAMRHPLLVQLGGHDGLTVATCVVRDPQSTPRTILHLSWTGKRPRHLKASSHQEDLAWRSLAFSVAIVVAHRTICSPPNRSTFPQASATA